MLKINSVKLFAMANDEVRDLYSSLLMITEFAVDANELSGALHAVLRELKERDSAIERAGKAEYTITAGNM